VDFSQFLPRETHRPLAWLGKHTDWLRTTVGPDNRIVFTWKFPVKDNMLSTEDYGFIDIIRETCASEKGSASDRMLALFYRAAAASLANGPKMFQPTPIQCEAMENVDVDVPFADYRQPFETLIIQLPDEYRRDAMQRLGLSEFPNYALVHHDLKSNIITVASNYNQRQSGETLVAVLRPTPQTETIEDEFRKEELRNEPMVDRLVQRLAVNMCLLLTHYRTRQRPLDPQYLSKLRQLSKKQDQKKADRAKTMIVGQVMVVEFEQQIKLHDEVEENPPEDMLPGAITEIRQRDTGEGATYTVRPHWRRGHWRRQHHGQKWLTTRKPDDASVIVDDHHHRVFIKPILVKRALFGGEKSQTSVLYKGGNKDEIRRAIRRPDEPEGPTPRHEYGG
jgi:hypothetical protein